MMGTKNITQERLAGLDLVKLLACFLVVALHTCNEGSFCKSIPSILYYTGVIAIPIFFITNGYLLFGRTQKDKWYSYKKIGRILFLTLLVNAILSVTFLIFKGHYFNLFKQIIPNLFFQSGYFWHFWFLGALILIYLVFPLFDYLYLHKKRLFFILSSFFICLQIAVDVLNIYYSVNYNDIFQSHIFQTFRIESHFSYFLLGGVIKTLKTKLEKLTKYISFYGAYVILYLISIAYMYFMVRNIYPLSYCEYYYNSMLIIAWAFFTVIAFQKIQLGEKTTKLISNLSGLVMLVYIIHPFIIGYFAKFGINTVALLFCVFITSIIISWLIIKIPFAKNILKI